jgi:hypothetical protein
MIQAPHVWVPKTQWTKLDRLKAALAPGRKATVSPGSHLHDLISLRKTVLMCPSCNYKFQQIYKRYNYRKTPFDADATCDDCKQGSLSAKVYCPEEYFNHHHAPHPAGGYGKYGGELVPSEKSDWSPFKHLFK